MQHFPPDKQAERWLDRRAAARIPALSLSKGRSGETHEVDEMDSTPRPLARGTVNLVDPVLSPVEGFPFAGILFPSAKALP